MVCFLQIWNTLCERKQGGYNCRHTLHINLFVLFFPINNIMWKWNIASKDMTPLISLACSLQGTKCHYREWRIVTSWLACTCSWYLNYGQSMGLPIVIFNYRALNIRVIQTLLCLWARSKCFFAFIHWTLTKSKNEGTTSQFRPGGIPWHNWLIGFTYLNVWLLLFCFLSTSL